MDSIQIKLLNYNFKFKKLRWREEFSIQFLSKQNPQRLVLAHALENISGFKPKNIEEALKVMDAIPQAIIDRVFKVWKGSQPKARKFITAKLYKAPEPVSFARRVYEEAEKLDTTVVDPAVREMEAKFGKKEVEEAREIDRKILEASKLRGAVKAEPDV